MAIKDWPQDDRPREKLLMKGADSLSDAELLAIFLRTGCVGKSAVELSRELLAEFGSLRVLLESDQKQFCQAQGLGPAKYSQLQAVLEMAKRHLNEQISRGGALNNPESVRSFLIAQLRNRHQEVFAVLFLDNQHRLIAYKELFFGTINSASVYPREVVKKCLENNAAAVILVHNHPSGVAQPSQADERITRHLQQILDLVDIRLLDHMIVGENAVVSMREKGLL